MKKLTKQTCCSKFNFGKGYKVLSWSNKYNAWNESNEMNFYQANQMLRELRASWSTKMQSF